MIPRRREARATRRAVAHPTPCARILKTPSSLLGVKPICPHERVFAVCDRAGAARTANSTQAARQIPMRILRSIELRARLNPDGATIEGTSLRVGDKVMRTRNSTSYTRLRELVAGS